GTGQGTARADRPASFEVEQILVLIRPLHAFLVVLLPHIRPRAAEHVEDLVLEPGTWRQRGPDAVHRIQRLNAFDVGIRRPLAELAHLSEVADDTDRLDERLRAEEHTSELQSREKLVR